jgi:tRNA-splicing ligase RtcB
MQIEQIDQYRYRIPKSGGMRTEGVVYADQRLMEQIKADGSLQQVANVAHLPGLKGCSLAMPDIHQGYGFPIGGVAAMAPEGVVSPGGVGSDINCGVRLLRTDLSVNDLTEEKLTDLVNALYVNIPSGIGSKGSIRLSSREQSQMLVQGARWAVKSGYGWEGDLECTESGGCLDGADPGKLTKRSFERGREQLGTLGAGNHFLEIQKVTEIYDEQAASVFGIQKDQIVVMIHSGSRGLGFQTCEDYLDIMLRAMPKYGISLPDRQLACCPVNSPEGRDYLAAMACSANYAWANRQCIMHRVRQSFEQVLKAGAHKLGLHLIYDVAHNIAKFEQHIVDGKSQRLLVHRKGATRAFGPGNPDLPERYRKTGQPVIIPGDMGRASYLLCGTEQAMQQSWGSTCHGAGRLMSRTQALRRTAGRSIARELGQRGILVRSHGQETLREEAPEAYKDVNQVVDIVHNAGLSRRVAKMAPLGVVKG